MAITKDAGTSSNEYTSASSKTFSHTTGADLVNSIIVVVVTSRDASATDGTVTDVTYNGNALTLAIAKTYTKPGGDTLRSEIWYRLAPDAGAHNVVVTHTGTVTRGIAYAVTFSGVSQGNTVNCTATFQKTESAPGGGADITVNVVPTFGGTCVIDIFYDTGDYATTTCDQTILFNTGMNTNGDGAGSSYEIIADSGAHTITWTKTDKSGMCSLAACCLLPYSLPAINISQSECIGALGHLS